MLTRREKLLVRPWQLRKFNNHKRKVINAVSIVDFGPPPPRNHVTVKLKKLQKERERQAKIEEDNFKLLQHLGAIMRTKRMNNTWTEKPPNFLRRVCIYHRTRTPTPCPEITSSVSTENQTRKPKCQACDPQPEKPLLIPEPRLPWAPPKKILTKRLSKSSVCPIKSDFDLTKTKSKAQAKKLKKEKSIPVNFKHLNSPIRTSQKMTKKVEETEQSILLCQGQIQIKINFPSLADVKIVRRKIKKSQQENLLMLNTKNYCGDNQ